MTSSALLAAVTAVCAQIILPLPFTPVFFSLLVLAVLLTGAVLPPRWAAAAQLCYLALGFFGVPVFGGFKGGPGVLLGPTGGYLAACPLMALVVALLIQGKKRTVWRYLAAMCAALVLCYTLGTIWFCLLTGVNVGFMPAGNYLGQLIAQLPYRWIIVPIGMLIGYFIVIAEPAVYVLTKQVEELTDGAISDNAMKTGLSISVAVSVGLAMLRVLTGISIFYLLVPGYAVAILLSFFVPKIFTAIAFDSGGVASGPMTATFLLPFAIGACTSVGGDVVTDAFGVVAMVAMTPLITIQVMGLIYKLQGKSTEGLSEMEPALGLDALPDDAIIEL